MLCGFTAWYRLSGCIDSNALCGGDRLYDRLCGGDRLCDRLCGGDRLCDKLCGDSSGDDGVALVR